jgi:hypothetical protein
MKRVEAIDEPRLELGELGGLLIFVSGLVSRIVQRHPRLFTVKDKDDRDKFS